MPAPAPLAKKVGPFTVGAWLAIGAGGVGIAILLRRSSLFRPGPTITAPDVPSTSPMDGNPHYGTPGLPSIITLPGQGVSGPAPGGQKPTNNSEWAFQATAYLIAQNYASPSMSQGAIGKFITGQPVTPQEAALVDLALKFLGPPPEYVPPLQVVNPGPTPPGTVPPPGGGGSLTTLGAAALIDQGSTSLNSGQDYRPYLEEAIRRVQGGLLSVNDEAWSTPNPKSGQPRIPKPLWFPVQQELFARGIVKW